MQRGRNPRFPTTPRGSVIPRRLVQSPTNLRIDALRFMPGTSLGEEKVQFLGEMVTTQWALQRDFAQQQEEANSRANVQNQALIRLMEAFRDRGSDPRLPMQPAQPLQEDTLSRGILDSIPFFSGNKTDSGREWIESIKDLGS